MSEKPSRGKNYTEREKILLLSIIDKYKTIIENKATNAVYIKEKKETWEKITKEFNSCAQEARDMKQLQAAYNNLKRTTRQDVAKENVKKYLAKLKKDEDADKKGIKATGGGTYTPVLSEVGAQMLALMGNQIKPLCNNYDSATEYYVDENMDLVDMTVDENRDFVEDNGVTPLKPNVPNDFGPDLDVPSPLAPQKKVLPPKKIKKLARGTKITDTVKMQFYRKKLECALVEKKARLVEYRTALKNQTLIDLQIKIKTAEYEKLLNSS